MNVYTTSVKESRVILGSFAYVWEQRKLGELALSFEYGLNAAAMEYDGVNKYLRITDIDDETHEFKTDALTTPDVDLTTADNYRLKEGDVLFARTGASVGKTYRYKGLDGLVYFAGFLIRARIKPECDAEFVFQNTLTDSYNRYITITSQRSGQPGVNAQEYAEFELTVPGLAEQRKIGSLFHILDNLITLHQRNPVFLFNLCLFREKIALFNQSDAAAPTWELRKFSDITHPAGEKNRDNLPLESYSITNEHGFIPQDEKFENGGTMREADKRMYYIVSPNSFAYNPARINVGSIGYQNTSKTVIVSSLYEVFKTSDDVDDRLLWHWFKSPDFQKLIEQLQEGGVRLYFYYDKLCMGKVFLPSLEEQHKIGIFFDNLDNLITLHQRNPFCLIMEVFNMLNEIRQTDLFCEYYAKWIAVYKKGAIRKVTMDKYIMTHQWLVKLVPHLKIADLNRLTYQQILNDYAMHHERQTTMDFHHQLKGAVLDAVDEGLIERDPTRKAIIKGKTPNIKKIKYINQFELHTLLSSLELKSVVSWDWFILLAAKTGMRFSEALAITPKDFDFAHQTLSISKTWDYKGNGGFLPTKNKSSVRKIQIDWQTVIQFSELVKGFPEKEPIFVTQKVYNSTVNDILARYCKRAKIPVISVHGLRHTHASLLLFAGVSIASVARRLGHASMTTTQKTYLHIIQELENKDVDLVMRSLSGLS